MSDQRSTPMASLLNLLFGAGWYLAIGVSAIGLIVIVAAFVLPPGSMHFDVPIGFAFADADQHRISAPSLGPLRAEIVDGRATLRVPYAHRWWLIPGLAVIVLIPGAIAAVFYQLRLILKTVSARRPFAAENVSRLRIIGLVVIGAELIWKALNYAAQSWLASTFAVEGLKLRPSARVNVVTILLGLLVIALAEVFRHGTELEADRSLTV
jgi:hypothetical protein